ncbi:8207_t:CDS:2, partial [Acaulospora morrowiae]
DNNIVQKILKPTIDGPFHNRFKVDIKDFKELGVIDHGVLANESYSDWNYHRKFLNKALMAPQFVKQAVNVVKDNFLEMSKYWDKLGEDRILEFNHWMKRYFMDTVFITAVSKPANSLVCYYNEISPDNELNVPELVLKEADIFLQSIDCLVQSLIYFISIPRVIRNFPGINKYTQYIKDRINWLKNEINDVIKSRREEIFKTPMDQKLIPDILLMFLTANTERDVTEQIVDDLHDKPMSDKDVESNLLAVLSGGISSSANTMCFLVYYLEKHPEVKQKMMEEIEHVIGKNPDSSFTFESLSKLEYIEAIIKEESRLKASCPNIARVNSVPEDVGGYKWSKGTNFLLNIDGIHYNKSYWKDSHTFNPNRFLKDPESDRMNYMFGGGMRK